MSGVVGVALGGSDALGIPLTSVGRTLWLVNGNRQLDLQDTDNNGFVISKLDLGAPTVRDASSNLPGQDGVWDPTSFFGPRVVSLDGWAGDSAAGSRGKAGDLLAPFLSPRGRPSLVYALEDDAELKELTLRVTPWSAPVSRPSSTDWQVQWVAADPIPLSVQTMQVDIGTGSDAGRTYPLTYPRTYPPSGSADGVGRMAIGGTYASYQLLRIFGPITNPKAVWLDADTLSPLGPSVAFVGLTVLAGQYLDVDMKAGTALLNSDPAADRFSLVDFPNSNFEPVDPGMIAIRFSGDGIDASTLCSVFWRNAWLQ